jgi:hypothetical protein
MAGWVSTFEPAKGSEYSLRSFVLAINASSLESETQTASMVPHIPFPVMSIDNLPGRWPPATNTRQPGTKRKHGYSKSTVCTRINFWRGRSHLSASRGSCASLPPLFVRSLVCGQYPFDLMRAVPQLVPMTRNATALQTQHGYASQQKPDN